MRMDQKLKERLKSWANHLESLKEIELTYLSLKASSESYYSKIYLNQSGTQKDKEAKTLIDPDWVMVSEGLVASESAYLDARRRLDLKIKAYEAEYMTYKHEMEFIKKPQ